MNITYIDPNSYIGDSLKDINQNFYEIDKNIHAIEQQTLKFSHLFKDYFNNSFANYINASNSLLINKDKFQQAYTLVESNSARWLHPLTLLYPCIIDDKYSRISVKVKKQISEWLNYYFPITTPTGDVNYVEGQTCYVSVTLKERVNKVNFIDETIDNSIRTLVFKVKDCIWKFEEYLTGSSVAIALTPTVSYSKTPTQTKTPTNTPTPTVTTTATPTRTLTPTPSPIDYFTMTLLGLKPDAAAGEIGTGYMLVNLQCLLGGYFTVKLTAGPRSYVYLAEDNTPAFINNLSSGTYNVYITNTNLTRNLTTVIAGTLILPYRTGRITFNYKGRPIFIGQTIQSS